MGTVEVVVALTTTTTIRYTYDPLYRLTDANYSGAHTYTFAYAYDAVGNRTTQTQTITSTVVTNYAYDAANRLTSVNGQAYTWDNNGNLKSDGSQVYTYTQANRLITVTASGLSWSAAYNGDGVRLRQITNGSVTTYTQGLAAPLPVVLQAKTGSATALYLFDMGTRPLAEYDSAWEYLLVDGLGSVRQVADGNGNVTLAESYDPYGSVLSSQGNATSVFGYTGEQTDVTGLVFLRARYMQPGLGMFLSRDAWEGNAMLPLSYNGWAYVEGNPLNRTDPTGHCDGCDRAFFVTVTGAEAENKNGLAFRSYPNTDAPVHFRMRDGSVVMLSGSKQVVAGEVWRYAFSSSGLGTFEGIYPWEGGWVRDRFLTPKYSEVSGGWINTTLPPADATAYPPHYQLDSHPMGGKFRLSPFFEGSYNVINPYGANAVLPNFLQDLQRSGHDGVDVVSSDSDPCTKVLAPVAGFVTAFSPDVPQKCDDKGNCTYSEPSTNPPGRTLSIKSIPGYPRLEVQLTHVSGDKVGQVNIGDELGNYAQIGYSYGPHLHITFKWQDYDKHYFVFDPSRYLP